MSIGAVALPSVRGVGERGDQVGDFRIGIAVDAGDGEFALGSVLSAIVSSSASLQADLGCSDAGSPCRCWSASSASATGLASVSPALSTVRSG